MITSFLRGSDWRKWDLHVHTPNSKLAAEGYILDDNLDPWDKFCEEIEKSDVTVFGITDYFSVDNYFIFIEKFNNKYPNSEKVFFPNIEFRLEDKNKENDYVNIHVIFSNELTQPEIQKFLDDVVLENVNGNRTVLKCNQVDLLSIGYNKALVKKESIQKSLKDNFGKKDVYLVCGVANGYGGIRPPQHEGRHAEYAKTIDEICPIFFGRAIDKEFFLCDRYEGSISKPVISGSDSHSFDHIDKWLGKQFIIKNQKGEYVIDKDITWIKADTTFEGLRQIIFEPNERIYIGEEPEIEIRVRENQRRYIKSVHINQIEGYDNRYGSWFKSEEIELNKELVAIIGNKGNGKSALADIIGLLGNSHNQKYERGEKQEELFSFLNKDKFLKDNCASNFKGELFWYSGLPDEKILNTKTDESVFENVEYLPQKYLEKICANIEDDEFRDKLNKVIFEYVKDKDKFKQTNLDDLIKYLTTQTDADIKVAKSNLHDINSEVISIEKKLIPDHKNDIKEKIKLKEADIEAHKSTQPKEVEKPKTGSDEAEKLALEIKEIENKITDLSKKIEDSELESSSVTRQAEDLRQASQSIKREIETITGLSTKYNRLFVSEGISFEDIVNIKVSYEKIDEIIKKKEEKLVELNIFLRNGLEIKKLNLADAEEKVALEKSLVCNKLNLENKKKEIIDQLDKPNREYQSYVSTQTQWQLRLKELEGEIENPLVDTLNWFKSELVNIINVYPEKLKDIKERRAVASKDVLLKKKSLINFYESVKLSIDEEIKKYGTDLGEYNISIEASLKFDQIFYNDFFEYVNQQVRGSFHGTEDGKLFLKKNIEEILNWEDEDNVIISLENIVSFFHNSDGEDRDIFKQMKQRKEPIDLYDYIFGFDYLKTKYDLRVDGKDLIELSPGERGGLLLIFYLMLDRRDIPLIIDQPEDNLDNQSVYEILVTFLKKAKKRRQIIIVTHNPNLAVVADAEQIIYVSINKKDGKNDFDFVSGSIENPRINKLVIDILEGTLPAFDNRKIKYKRN